MALRDYTNFRQNNKSNSDYLEEFKAKQQLAKRLVTFTEKDQAALFLMNSDDKRYKGLKTDLHNQFLMGQNLYPTDLEQACKLLDGYK